MKAVASLLAVLMLAPAVAAGGDYHVVDAEGDTTDEIRGTPIDAPALDLRRVGLHDKHATLEVRFDVVLLDAPLPGRFHQWTARWDSEGRTFEAHVRRGVDGTLGAVSVVGLGDGPNTEDGSATVVLDEPTATVTMTFPRAFDVRGLLGATPIVFGSGDVVTGLHGETREGEGNRFGGVLPLLADATDAGGGYTLG